MDDERFDDRESQYEEQDSWREVVSTSKPVRLRARMWPRLKAFVRRFLPERRRQRAARVLLLPARCVGDIILDPEKLFSRLAGHQFQEVPAGAGAKPVGGAKVPVAKTLRAARNMLREIERSTRVKVADTDYSVPLAARAKERVDLRFTGLSLDICDMLTGSKNVVDLAGVGVGTRADGHGAFGWRHEFLRIQDHWPIDVCYASQFAEKGVQTREGFHVERIRSITPAAAAKHGLLPQAYNVAMTSIVCDTKKEKTKAFRFYASTADGIHWMVRDKKVKRYLFAMSPIAARLIELGLMVAISHEWDWRAVLTGKSGASIMMPVDPETAIRLFRYRDRNDAEKRRSPMLHWVKPHDRVTGSDVRPHLRGIRSFTMGDVAVQVLESQFDASSYGARTLPTLRTREQFLNWRIPKGVRDERREWYEKHRPECEICQDDDKTIEQLEEMESRAL